jgi:hypothetical protein
MQPRCRHHRARCFRMRRVDLRRCVRTVGHHAPARKPHAKPAFGKKPAPRSTDPTETS